MNPKRKQLLVAILVGVVAVALNHVYLTNQIEQAGPGKKISIMRAKKQIPAGTTLTAGLIQRAKVPKAFAPKARIAWEDRQLYLGQVVAVDVLRGDYVLDNYFSSRGVLGSVLSEQIDGENARAITLPVDETSSLARSLVAGDRIDILFSFSVPVANTRMTTVLLQNVPVISTGSYSVAEQELGSRGGRSKRYNTLTVKLGAADAMRLTFARQNGDIHIMLRNNKDNSVVTLPPVTGVVDLLSAEEKEVVVKAMSARQRNDEEKEKLRQQIQEVFAKQQQQKGLRSGR